MLCQKLDEGKTTYLEHRAALLISSSCYYQRRFYTRYCLLFMKMGDQQLAERL